LSGDVPAVAGSGATYVFNVKSLGDNNLITTDTANDRVGFGTGTPNSKIQIVGSLSLSYIAKTANYTLTVSDYTVDCTTNTFTITLPTAVGVSGRIYNIKNTGTGVITVNTTSSQTIDQYASGAINLVQWENLQVQSNNANWIII